MLEDIVKLNKAIGGKNMEKNKIKSIEDTMNDVISTSKNMRDYLKNEKLSLKKEQGN